MNPNLLRPLTLTSLAALLVLAPGARGAGDVATLQPVRVAAAPASTPTTQIRLGGLTRGHRPRIAFVRGRHLGFEVGDYRLNRPDGTSLRLPRGTWADWAPMGRGAIGTFGTEAGPEVQVVDGSGHVTSTMIRHFGLAVSPDRKIVGWLLGRFNTPHVVEGGGSRTFDLPRIGHGLAIGTISGSRTCKEQAPEGGGCTVFVNTAHDRTVWISTSHGIVDQVGPMRSVTDVDQRGRVVGRAADSAGRRCFGMWNLSGHRAWRTCSSRLASFSPDGRRVLGTDQGRDRFGGVHAVTLYSDGGRRLAAYAVGAGDHILQAVWEDRTHVLANVFELGASSHCPGTCRGHWAVVRLGVGGSMALATPVVAGGIDLHPFSLPLT